MESRNKSHIAGSDFFKKIDGFEKEGETKQPERCKGKCHQHTLKLRHLKTAGSAGWTSENLCQMPFHRDPAGGFV
jgi:hypothetical protein